MADKGISSLADIWPLQAALNRRAGIDTLALGEALKAERDADDPARGAPAGDGVATESDASAPGQDIPRNADPAVTLAVGRALKNYIDALSAECHELQDCLSWKHWYREAKEGRQYELKDLQNARVEAADMLFFWVSICQLLGLSPDDVFRLYEAKLGINHRRQDENRSQQEHGRFEHENRAVK
jgi:NTP pyrophosphatase (non-canonical NTP hydrolase)